MTGRNITTYATGHAKTGSDGAVGRDDLADAVYRCSRGLTRIESRELVDQVLAEIADAIVVEGRVSLSGFGLFATSEKGARIGRNPKTSETYPIPPRKVLRFAAAIGLRKQVADAHLAEAPRAMSSGEGEAARDRSL